MSVSGFVNTHSRLQYPTILDVILNLRLYGFDENRCSELWRAYYDEFNVRIDFFEGKQLPPLTPFEILQSRPLIAQSGRAMTADSTIKKAIDGLRAQNVQFEDSDDPYVYEMREAPDPTRMMQDDSQAPLGEFFSRPIKIAEEQWSPSIDLAFDIDPWSLFFDNPRVTNRLANFYMLRAKLRVKVVINGNGFYYGRLLVNYLPMATYDEFSSNAALVRQDLVQASQCPHIFVDPATSEGGEMQLPFFWHENYLNIPSAEWSRMGTLFFRTLTPLKHANGATDPITVTVFAWAEDVELTVPTSRVPVSILPQSGEVDEANMKGTISGPATSVAKFAAYLKGVPYIAPFALATEIGAKATASMAKIFGYSRPTITKAPEPFKPTLTSSLAVTNVPDNSQKLTVDDKQELTIDPRISGIAGPDPMNIREIAKRESYLTSFQWAKGAGPDTLLWNSLVTPDTWAESGSSPIAYHFPACAFAVLPFKYWKGTMRFRFQVVCSNYHKGRLKIVFDPDRVGTNTYLGFSEFNTNFIRIVDLAEENDFTIECGMAQAVSFLEHRGPPSAAIPYSDSSAKVSNGSTSNGVIGVYVLNELTTPNSVPDNDISVNVFVSMGEDFEVALPTDKISCMVAKPPPEPNLVQQSGDVAMDEQHTSETDAPQQSTSTIVGLPPADDPQLNKVFLGESVTSFRQVLKRFVQWNTLIKDRDGASIVSGRYPWFPYYRGYMPGAVDTTGAGDPYNYVNTLLVHWVTLAFSGWRGSHRYKFVPQMCGGFHDTIWVLRGNMDDGELSYQVGSIAIDPWTSLTEARWGTMTSSLGGVPLPGSTLAGYEGMAVTNSTMQQTLEVEIPYQTNIRFTPGKKANYTDIQQRCGAFDWRYYSSSTSSTGDSMTVNVLHAIGEDFQVYFFTGLPRMYCETDPPIP